MKYLIHMYLLSHPLGGVWEVRCCEKIKVEKANSKLYGSYYLNSFINLPDLHLSF